MNDYLVKALAYDGQVRAFAVKTTETVAEAQRRHKHGQLHQLHLDGR